MSDTRDRGRRGPGGDRPRKGPPAGPRKGAGGDDARRPGKPGGKPFQGRSSEGKPAEGRSFRDKPFGDKRPGGKFGDRPAGKSFGAKSFDAKGRPERTEGAGRSFDKPRERFRSDDAPRPPRARHEGRDEGRPAAYAERPAFASRRPPRKDGPRKPDVSKPLPTSPSAREDGGQRIAKAMARAGLCSRRDAERWIEEGRVAVNGKVLDSPGVTVSPSDRITVDGVPLAARERTRLFMFHKPRGTVTTDRDPEGRTTIFDALPEGLPRVVTIGRLDINTEGLLLLTNDGGLARVLELPSTGWLRRYRVRAHGDIDQPRLDALRGGVEIDGVQYAGIEAVLDRVQGSNVWLTMGLREGKNREIKRVLEHLGLSVNRLIRISFGPFQLGELPEGEVEEVRMRVLKEQLGAKLAAEAGVDFTSDLASERESSDRPPRSPDPRGGERPLRGRRNAAPEVEERRPPPERPKPGSRKHVSTIRAERGQETERKRTVMLTTEDRRGRTVTVERREKAKPEPEKKERRSERFGASAPRARTDRSERPERSERPAGPRKTFGGEDRPARSRGEGGFGSRPPREGGAHFERPERSERPAGPRKSFGGEDRPARPRGEGGFGSRPPREGGGGRSFGGKSDGRKGPPRKPGGGAPKGRGR